MTYSVILKLYLRDGRDALHMYESLEVDGSIEAEEYAVTSALKNPAVYDVDIVEVIEEFKAA